MKDFDAHTELGRRIHMGVDPMLPPSGVEHRVLAEFREHVGTANRRLPAWLRPFQLTLANALVTVVVVALVGGALGLTLTLRGKSTVVGPSITPIAPVTPPTQTHPPAPTPSSSPTPSAPGAIAYVQPESVSFPSATDGWVAGNACDTQGRCESGIARTTDGGIRWSLITPPANPLVGLALSIAASSSDDAWVWGTDPDNTGIPPFLAATHDAGRTWEPVNLNGAEVVDVEIADGTAWAETTCTANASPCGARLLSQPVRGGVWTDPGAIPAAVQGPAFSNTALSDPQLVRSGTRSWVISPNQPTPALVSTSDGGRDWTRLPIPCTSGANMVLGASSDEHLMLACVNDGGWPAPQAVWTSNDGGARWTLKSRRWYTGFQPPQPNVGNLNNQGAPIALAVINGQTAWMANDRGDDLVTHDGGVSWSAAPLPVDYFGNAGGGEGVTFADPMHGWTFVTAGMWATTDGGVHWIRQSVIGPVTGY